jgi:hypothetical protein
VTGTVFLNTSTLTAREAITGHALPAISAKLQAALTLTVKFFSTGEAAALLSSPTFRVTLKATPTGSPFVFTSTIASTLADGYTFAFTSVDSAALRTAIGDLTQLDAFGEVEWTVATVVERVSFPLTIVNAYLRTDDDAPDPIAEESATWLTAQLAARITAAGYMEFQNTAGDWFYLPMNSGRAPG